MRLNEILLNVIWIFLDIMNGIFENLDMMVQISNKYWERFHFIHQTNRSDFNRVITYIIWTCTLIMNEWTNDSWLFGTSTMNKEWKWIHKLNTHQRTERGALHNTGVIQAISWYYHCALQKLDPLKSRQSKVGEK